MRFAQTAARFLAKAQGKRQPRSQAQHVFGVTGTEQGPPVQRSRSGIVKERCRRVAGDKRLQTRKRELAVLAERKVFIRLHALDPRAEGPLVTPVSPYDLIFVREKIAVHVEVAAVVAARETDLRGGIRCRAAAHVDGAHAQVADEAQIHARRGSSRRRLAVEEITGARKTETRRVEERGRERMGLFHAQHLLAQAFDVLHERVYAGSRIRAVVNGVGDARGIFARKSPVDPRRAEIVADRLQREAGERGDAAAQFTANRRSARRWRRGPKVQERRHPAARRYHRAFRRVGHVGDLADVQVLLESLKIGEEKCLILLYGAADGSSKLIALKWRRHAVIEKARRIEHAVA